MESVSWNPWHGCTKVSPGCKFCYVYRQDEMFGSELSSAVVRKTGMFDLPIRRGRNGEFKIPSGSVVFTCFTSDFLVEGADVWREDAWRMIRRRPDCMFVFFTKRIVRFMECMPSDWGEGYENVLVGCTVENQVMADIRLPIFRRLPIRHRAIIVAPLLERIDLSSFLDGLIEEVSVGGESGRDARVCDFDWVLNLREQCVMHGVSFCFHQTGARFLKEGRLFRIERRFQRSQARRANIDFKGGV